MNAMTATTTRDHSANGQWVGGGYLVSVANQRVVVERWQQLGMWHPVQDWRADTRKGMWMPHKVLGIAELAELVNLADLERVA